MLLRVKKMKLIQTTISPSIVGKPEKHLYTNKDGETKSIFKCGDKVVNLASDWMNVEGTMEDIFEVITTDGLAIVPAIIKDNHRTSENFIESTIVMVDIDDGLTIEQATVDPLYIEYASGYYTTTSHKPDHHKFRIVFELEETITDANAMTSLYSALISHFGGDKACKDASRLFYGNPTPASKSYKEAVLPSVIVNKLIDDYNSKKEAEALAAFEKQAQYVNREQTDSEKQLILELIHSGFHGNYNTITSIGWALQNSGFSVMDFCRCIPLLSDAEKIRIWNARCNKTSQYSMGTIMYYIYSWHGKAEVISQLSNLRFKESKLNKIEKMRNRLSKMTQL